MLCLFDSQCAPAPPSRPVSFLRYLPCCHADVKGKIMGEITVEKWGDHHQEWRCSATYIAKLTHIAWLTCRLIMGNITLVNECTITYCWHHKRCEPMLYHCWSLFICHMFEAWFQCTLDFHDHYLHRRLGCLKCIRDRFIETVRFFWGLQNL